jgi:methylglyoxal/glyoxal reductase
MEIPSVNMRNRVKMPSMVVGTFEHREKQHLDALIRNAVDLGFRAFDTAPSYKNEAVLGEIFEELIGDGKVRREDLFIIDKIDGWQMHQGGGNVVSSVKDALSKLRLEYLDLLLIHWPFPEYFSRTWESFVEIYCSGVAKAIGVCNVRERHLLSLVEETDFVPHVVQIERHPLNTVPGLLGLNQKLGILSQVYSPVCRMIDRIASSSVLVEISQKHSRSVGQVIMRWHIDTGVVPVFMTTKASRLEEYARVFEFQLDDADVERISALNRNYKIFLESWGCPGF